MTHRLLREYIQLALEARLAPGFDTSMLKKLKTPPEIYDYVKDYLPEMGRGSSRATFLLGSRKILKLAKNQAGIGQNEAEVDVYTNPSTKGITTKIFEYDPKYNWLVAELVRPLKSGDFERMTRWGFDEFGSSLANVKAFGMTPRAKEDIPNHMKKFFDDVIQVIKSGELELSDLRVEDHWGKTADGRIVLLDYGYTNDVKNQHYVNSFPKNFPGIPKTVDTSPVWNSAIDRQSNF